MTTVEAAAKRGQYSSISGIQCSSEFSARPTVLAGCDEYKESCPPICTSVHKCVSHRIVIVIEHVQLSFLDSNVEELAT